MRDGQKHEERLLYWPITSSLDTVLSSRPHLAFLLLGRGYPIAAVSCCPQQCALSDCKLPLIHTASKWPHSHMGICIYYFITPMTSDQPRNCLHSFILVHLSQGNLWLMALSKVNMKPLHKCQLLVFHQILPRLDPLSDTKWKPFRWAEDI